MYIAIDGDSVGTKLQQLILEGKLEELKCFSNSIKETLFRFAEILEQQGSVIYMNGGDNIFAECSQECAQIIANYVYRENKKNSVCYSLAVGETAQDTYMGLNYSKSSKMHFVEVIRDGTCAVFKQMI